MKIRSIDCLGLFGKSPKGGWSNEIQPGDSVHALVIVKTDAGLIGVGSVFTDSRLAEAALNVLRPLAIGETAIEPMRVTEKLHQNSFWMGHGGALTHTISGIDIALWDIFGQVTGQPIGRLLGGNYRTRVQAYASILMEMPELMEERTAFYRAQGFKAIKIGWGPFGRVSRKLDEQIVRAARKGAGFLYGTNFSIGVQTMYRLAKELAVAVPHYRFKIIETHHVQKKDAPSGTALSLRQAVQTANPSLNVPIESKREGDVAGVHILEARTEDELIELKHESFSRRAFAEGAVLAAEWIVGKTGVWDFTEIASQLSEKK